MSNEEIRNIINILERLDINNQTLRRDIDEARTVINNIVATGNTIPAPPTQARTKSRKNYDIGDSVIIKNPKKNQQNSGIIIGFTKTGFAKIRTNNGNVIRRITYNLTHIQDE